MTRIVRILALASLAAPLVMIWGCSTDVDPDAKVDAPGYYNGPMKAKGTGAETKATEKAPE